MFVIGSLLSLRSCDKLLWSRSRSEEPFEHWVPDFYNVEYSAQVALKFDVDDGEEGASSVLETFVLPFSLPFLFH